MLSLKANQTIALGLSLGQSNTAASFQILPPLSPRQPLAVIATDFVVVAGSGVLTVNGLSSSGMVDRALFQIWHLNKQVRCALPRVLL